jgi:hypothetical protein
VNYRFEEESTMKGTRRKTKAYLSSGVFTFLPFLLTVALCHGQATPGPNKGGVGGSGGSVIVHAGLRAGFTEVDITPPVGLEMAGFGPFLERKGTTVHDPLQAHVAVLELNGERLAIVGCDLLAVDPAMVAEIREEIGQRIGLPGSRILIAATHTHSAPAVVKLVGWGEEDPAYLKLLPTKIVEGVVYASGKLEPVTLSFGEVPVDHIAQNREYKDGPVDKTVRVLKFTHEGKLAGFIVNYSVHNVIFSEYMHAYSKDLTGFALEKVEKEFPGSVGVYLQGSIGDLNPYKMTNFMAPADCVQLLEELSTRFAGYVEDGLKVASPVSVTRLASLSTKIELPLVPSDRPLLVHELLTAQKLLKDPSTPKETRQTLEFEEGSARAVLQHYSSSEPDVRTTEVQAMLIQNIVIVANGSELFTNLGEQVRQMLPGLHVLVNGYSNDYLGYIPTPDRYNVDGDRYSYPAYFVPRIRGTFPFRPDVGDTLVKNMVRLAIEVTGGLDTPKD